MINILAITIVSLIQFFIGYLWYSKFLFGNIFIKSLGKPEEEMEMKAINIIGPLVIAFIAFLFFAILLDLFGTYDLVFSLLLSIIVWVGFIATTNLYAVFFEDRNFMLYLLNIGYQLVGLLIGALILSIWQ